MKPLRFGAHGAGRLDGDHFQATRGKPSRIATKSARLSRGEANLSVFPGGLEMAEAITINDQELAIICDLMGGWGAKWDGKLDDNKRQALDQVIARGFAEPSEKGSLTRYRRREGRAPTPTIRRGRARKRRDATVRTATKLYHCGPTACRRPDDAADHRPDTAATVRTKSLKSNAGTVADDAAPFWCSGIAHVGRQNRRRKVDALRPFIDTVAHARTTRGKPDRCRHANYREDLSRRAHRRCSTSSQAPANAARFRRLRPRSTGWTLDEPDITNVLLKNDNVG
jgi:hypothetical protein